MLNLIQEYSIRTLDMNMETERLAEVYVAEGVIPDKYRTDGQHIASAVINGLDFIVSLNFTHIVKRKTIEMTELLNFREGYKKVGIYCPHLGRVKTPAFQAAALAFLLLYLRQLLCLW
jgi:hypothetical protein